jgi:uncharacterized protein YneF (UPF0154 family)
MIEVGVGVAIGYFVALATQLIAFPLLSIPVSLSNNFLLGLIFTVVSVIRGYFVRRLFNWMHTK